MKLNVTAIADVCRDAIASYNRAIGDSHPLGGEPVVAVLIESVRWVLDNPLADEFALLRAWDVAEESISPAASARAGLVRAITLELGGEA